MPKAINSHTSRTFFSASVSISINLFAFLAVSYQEKRNSKQVVYWERNPFFCLMFIQIKNYIH